MSTKLLYFFYDVSLKIQIRKLIHHLALQKKKKEQARKNSFKICPSTHDDRCSKIHLSSEDSSNRTIDRPVSLDSILKNAATLFLRAFRELIIRRDCRLGNGRPSTNPDETMRARLISRRAAFNANSP